MIQRLYRIKESTDVEDGTETHGMDFIQEFTSTAEQRKALIDVVRRLAVPSASDEQLKVEE